MAVPVPDCRPLVRFFFDEISNGTWTGYSTNSRNTGSAFVSSSVLASEPGDPIIRVDHSLVKDIKAEMSLSGSKYDKTNTSYMYDSVPKCDEIDKYTFVSDPLKELLK